MITSKKEYHEYLEADRIALGRDPRRCVLFCLDPIWAYQRLLRKCEYYNNCKKRGLWRLYLLLLRFIRKQMGIVTGFCIPINAVGPGLFLTHTGSFLVANNARIGKNLRTNINVIIGENNGYYNVPTIGDNVVIEPGAKIFGKITIASGVHIGANAVVNKSIEEENVVVAGVPAKVIKKRPEEIG